MLWWLLLPRPAFVSGVCKAKLGVPLGFWGVMLTLSCCQRAGIALVHYLSNHFKYPLAFMNNTIKCVQTNVILTGFPPGKGFGGEPWDPHPN